MFGMFGLYGCVRVYMGMYVVCMYMLVYIDVCKSMYVYI